MAEDTRHLRNRGRADQSDPIRTQCKRLNELYAKLIEARRRRDGTQRAVLQDLRQTVLLDGIPFDNLDTPGDFYAGQRIPSIKRKEVRRKEAMRQRPGMPDTRPAQDDADGEDWVIRPVEMTLRGRMWKVLLGIDELSARHYLALVARGKCDEKQYQTIRGDSFRTLAGGLAKQVPEPRIIRVLVAYVHKFCRILPYSQGMNLILAPFLYTLPEVDAFFAFSHFVTRRIPLYFGRNTEGVKAATKLIDDVLETVDKKVYLHLEASSPRDVVDSGMALCTTFAFPMVSSLCASMPPFDELLKLWDFLIAFGPHLVVLCVAGQVMLHRDRVLATDKPFTVLNYLKMPSLDAKAIISMVMTNVAAVQANPQLWRRIKFHGCDPAVCAEILGREVEGHVVNDVPMVPDEYKMAPSPMNIAPMSPSAASQGAGVSPDGVTPLSTPRAGVSSF